MLIETDRLVIRRFSSSDWKDIYEYLSQEQVVKYEPYGVLTDLECKKEAAIRSMNKAFLAVCLKGSCKLIGNLYFAEQEPKEFATWELGYVFNPIYYGKGYATESCRAIIDHGFKYLKVRRVVAMCNPDNISSWKLLERLKMRQEGHLLKNIYFKVDENGKPIWNDTYEYAILADEWIPLALREECIYV
ncbi:MAG: GNAT family N-acetyltransferase [Clostridiales bacterium]|jgi:RimJ/RimL family protein N-acetyltransferase|nr:GNAT family N-acetyltransferase [Clostridiales bacterium]